MDSDSCTATEQGMSQTIVIDSAISQRRAQAISAQDTSEESPNPGGTTTAGNTRQLKNQSWPDLNSLTLCQSPKLLSIPIEIQLAIISKLTFPAIQFLRLTNRHFMTLIPPLTHAALLEAEKSNLASAQDVYACAVCLRLRRSGSFADQFRRSAFDRDRKDGKQAKRFCIDCGVESEVSLLKYRWGDTWTRFGVPYVKCRGCLGKKRGVRERRDCPMCPSCWERKNGMR